MHVCGRWLAALGLLAGPLAAPVRPSAGDPADLASRVVVLANANDADSVRLARYYAEKRGVPPGNVIALPMSSAETIGWPEFINTVYQPLQDGLVARGWIDAFGTTLTDGIGRKRYGIHGHRISYLVVCRGVPLRVNDEQKFHRREPRFTLQAEFATNAGAVDSELSLLAHSTYDINGWLPNPWFGAVQASLFEAEPVVKVARLDGPAFADAAGLVDHAMEAERTGLLGRFYVSVRGPSRDGERWFEQSATELASLGFDGDVDRSDQNLPSSSRFDAPVLYFGWYAQDLSGPMAPAGFRFPPGAIALHLHSFSARTLRSTTAGWCGPLVARGVTATFGNVFEPYLEFTLQPQMLLEALRRGRNLGDAAYYATRALSWQTIIIGDPLYRPFLVPLEAQMADVAGLPPSLAPYAFLRKGRLLEQGKRPEEALRLLEEEFRQRPGMVLALAVAQRLAAGGDRTGAAAALCRGFGRESFDIGQTPPAQMAARQLVECGAATPALAIYRAILRNAGLGQEWRMMVLREAVNAAHAAGDEGQSSAWEEELGGSPAP
jgi:uncharacterized protein (TIGR03790 family)